MTKIYFNSHASADLYASYNFSDEYMGLYLHIDSLIEVDAVYKFILKNSTGTQEIKDEIEYQFPPHADFGWGCPNFVLKFDVLSATNKFIQNGFVVVDIDVSLWVTYSYPLVTSPILPVAQLLYESQKYSDFTFDVEEKEIKVHKCILGVASPVFDRMFNTNCIEARENRSAIKEFDFQTVEISVKLIYGFEILHNDTDTNVVLDLYRFAHQYEIKASLNAINKWFHSLSMSKNTVWMLISFSFLYDMSYLKQECLDFLNENKEYAASFDGYEDINPEIIKEVFRFVGSKYQQI
ncbi:hypothetical protein FO519_009103 [Halicephalobus sp. NKZ332]|nr:hypothetical protein FO519_009103 [Halicephalobus sp. NKZ332]